MSAAVFRGTALFIWSRNRVGVACCAVGYATVLIGSKIASVDHSPLFQSMGLGFLLFTPLVIPLLMFISSGLNANADLTSPEGLFPRYFFVLPAATAQIVQPFMLYAALFAAAQWGATELFEHGRLLAFLSGKLWIPPLGVSFVLWMQALLWTPVAGRLVRAMQLLALLCAYVFVFVEATRAAFSPELTVTLSIAQLPLAYVVAVRGVAKCRRGDPSPSFVSQPLSVGASAARAAAADTSAADAPAARGRRAALQFASPLDAQLWMERRVHRWTGKSFLVAVLPAVLLMLLLIALLMGAHGDVVRNLGMATSWLLLVSLVITGLSTGLNFGSFQANVPWNQPPAAYSMPAYLATLPLSNGDFAWAKMRAATTRMLWVSLWVVLICALITQASGFADSWMAQHAAWRAEYGIAATLALTALTPLAVVLLTLSVTGGIIWLVLSGRSRSLLPWTFCAFCGLCLLAPHVSQEQADKLLHVVLPTAALLKACGLVGLVYYVGSRRLLSWGRLAVIASFWAGTAGTVVAWIRWNVPQGPLTPLSGLWIGVLAAPVLGAVAAPLVLGWNRAR